MTDRNESLIADAGANTLLELAERLTDNQRRDLIASEAAFWWSSDRRTTNAMFRKGLIEKPGYSDCVPFTPLGKALREHALRARVAQ
jgi:hypothetical protein